MQEKYFFWIVIPSINSVVTNQSTFSTK
jgi:hypothetical protein